MTAPSGSRTLLRHGGSTLGWRLVVAAALLLLSSPVRADEGDAPAGALLEAPKPRPVEPPAATEIDAALRRGMGFLIADQNADGSWGSARRTKDLNIYAPVPGAHHAFRSAVTSLCVWALVETDSQSADVQEAVERGEDWLLENLPNVRRATPVAIYNTWSHAYAIRALLRMRQRGEEDTERRGRIDELIRQQIDLLGRYESVDGGWGYYDFRAGTKKPASSSTSFLSATILIAFHEAQEAGFEVPEVLIQRAVASIQRQLKPDFSYIYGEYLKWYPMMPINRPGGSLGRSQACNLALRLWGDERITDQVIEAWLNRLFARNEWLGMGRKRPIPHESWFQVAGYFYYYGHFYAAGCIEQLPLDRRAEHQDQLATILLRLQEKDGSWWDYPLYNYHQQYGTAYALMTLTACRRAAGEGQAAVEPVAPDGAASRQAR